jgi:hypothetical protein
MAAHESIHPLQFKLFMSGEEWKQSVTDSVDRPFVRDRKMSTMWSEKLSESKEPHGPTHGSGIHADLRYEGYVHNADDPPTILVGSKNKLAQGEGHHRVAAAADIERTTGKPIWIPTNYEKRGGGYT